MIIIGATNRLEDLDPAIQRRFKRRIYVGTPNEKTRIELIQHGMHGIEHTLTDADLQEIAMELDEWSGADIYAVCREAALRPVRRYHHNNQHRKQQEEQQQQQQREEEQQEQTAAATAATAAAAEVAVLPKMGLACKTWIKLVHVL